MHAQYASPTAVVIQHMCRTHFSATTHHRYPHGRVRERPLAADHDGEKDHHSEPGHHVGACEEVEENWVLRRAAESAGGRVPGTCNTHNTAAEEHPSEPASGGKYPHGAEVSLKD